MAIRMSKNPALMPMPTKVPLPRSNFEPELLAAGLAGDKEPEAEVKN